jgi:endogenous inhibitor of DNA gyrase (YacG/DUF329 family)
MAKAPDPDPLDLARTATCPICKGTFATCGSEAQHSPFCSNRCKLVDLSRWLGEEYRVAGTMMGDGAGIDPLSLDEEDYP